jgi:hypothetical protein
MIECTSSRCAILSTIKPRGNLTSWTSSTAKYASVGKATLSGLTSTITSTEFGLYFLKSSLISKSDERSLGPEWYHPTNFSLAIQIIR